MTDVDLVVFPSKDRRLDWVMQHDPKSMNFLAAAALPTTVAEQPKMWTTGTTLDQGAEGACVGFGWTAELMASPRPNYGVSETVGNAFAQKIFVEARRDFDEWAGEDYDGTSVLAGAKSISKRGYIGEYRWATNIEDIRKALITEGPVVIGIPWLDDMYETRPSGLVTVGGEQVGGHCITLTGYHPSMRLRGEDYSERFRVFRWCNSWGTSYGVNGNGFIRYEDLRDLMDRFGEACVPMQRKYVRIV